MYKPSRLLLGLWIYAVAFVLAFVVDSLYPNFGGQHRIVSLVGIALTALTVLSIWLED